MNDIPTEQFPWTQFARWPVRIDELFGLHAHWLRNAHIKDVPEHKMIMNTQTMVAVLTIASGFERGAQSNQYVDNSVVGSRYYRTASTISTVVRKILNDKELKIKAVLVDVSDLSHTRGLYVAKNRDADRKKRFEFYGFDCNNGCAAMCISNQARKILPTVETVPIWTTWSGNPHGLCFGLTYAFFHEVLVNGYEPTISEPTPITYFIKRKKAIHNDEDGSRTSRLGAAS